MKILLLGRHFWPDKTPASRLHLAVLEHLVQQGHTATVFTAQPSYNNIRHDRQPARECRNGVDIVRVSILPERKHQFPIRLVNAVYFMTRALWFALRHPSDLILVHTFPPVLPGLTAWLVHRLKGTPFVYHCMDVQPESARIAGKCSRSFAGKAVYAMLRRLDRNTCRAASAVVTLSREMAETLMARGWTGQGLQLINNFHTEPISSHAEPDSKLLPDMPVERHLVVFAGNMGSFQGLDLVVHAVRCLRDHSQIQFLFMGAGECREQLERLAGDLVGQTVHFLPFRPLDEAMSIVGQADLAVLSLLPEVFSTAVPSKTMMYLRAGCPILALIEPHCELARIIQQHGLGVVPNRRDPQIVAQAILEHVLRGSPDAARRAHIRSVGEELYGYERTLGQWSTLIDHLARKASSGSQIDGSETSRQLEASPVASKRAA